MHLFTTEVGIFVQISMDLLAALCKQWKDQYQELDQQRKLIEDTMDTLKSLITANGGLDPEDSTTPEPAKIEPVLKQTGAPAPAQANDYDIKGSWAYKIEYVLATRSGTATPLPVADIASAIHTLEPGLDMNKIIKAVTMEASKMGLNGRLGIKKKGNKNFYLLPKKTVGEQGAIIFE